MKFILDQIIVPAAHRVGSMVGSYLTLHGMAETDVNIVITAVPLLLGFGVDLVVRKLL